VNRLLKKINFTGVTECPKGSYNRPRSVRTSEFWGKIKLFGGAHLHHEGAFHVYKNPHETGRKMDISRSSVRRIAKHDLRLKIYKRFQVHCDSIGGAALFSKVVFNKLRGNVHNEITSIILCRIWCRCGQYFKSYKP